jgi:hypothetical protein
MTRNNVGGSLWRSCDPGKMLPSKQTMPVHKNHQNLLFPGSWTLNEHSDCCRVFGMLM